MISITIVSWILVVLIQIYVWRSDFNPISIGFTAGFNKGFELEPTEEEIKLEKKYYFFFYLSLILVIMGWVSLFIHT